MKLPDRVTYPFGIAYPLRGVKRGDSEYEGYFHAPNSDVWRGFIALGEGMSRTRRLYVFTHEVEHGANLWLKWVVSKRANHQPYTLPDMVGLPLGYDIRVDRPATHKDGAFFEYPPPRIVVPKTFRGRRAVVEFAFAYRDAVTDWSLWVHDYVIGRARPRDEWLRK